MKLLLTVGLGLMAGIFSWPNLKPTPPVSSNGWRMVQSSTRGTNLPRAILLASSPSNVPSLFLNPGVYQTKPFSGLVLVPPEHLDDKLIHRVTPASSMPIIVPDLQFIPKRANSETASGSHPHFPAGR